MADKTQESILIAFRAHVLSVVGVSDKLGDRLYLDAGERPTVPYAVLSVDDSTMTQSHSGQTGVQFLDVSIETFARTATKAIQLRDAIVNGIKGFSGDVNGTFLNRITYTGQSDYQDRKTKLFGHVLDFSIQA